MISIIAAMNKYGTLGLDGDMPWHAPEDLKLFKEYTMGKTLVMGRKTFEGLPVKLRGRNILIVSRDKNISDIDNLEEYLINHKEDELVIAGGGEIYKQALPFVDRLVLSFIKNNDVVGDTFFPKFNINEFEIISRVEYEQFTHIIYERR